MLILSAHKGLKKLICLAKHESNLPRSKGRKDYNRKKTTNQKLKKGTVHLSHNVAREGLQVNLWENEF
jgi:hypothetical protein